MVFLVKSQKKFTLVCYFQSEQQLDCALDLMRRLPPQQIEKNLSDLIDLVSTFLSRVRAVDRHCRKMRQKK